LRRAAELNPSDIRPAIIQFQVEILDQGMIADVHLTTAGKVPVHDRAAPKDGTLRRA
jgi:hypothetical protein